MIADLTRARLIPCPDCRGLMLDTVALGRHGPHLLGTVTVNCINQPIPEWP